MGSAVSEGSVDGGLVGCRGLSGVLGLSGSGVEGARVVGGAVGVRGAGGVARSWFRLVLGGFAGDCEALGFLLGVARRDGVVPSSSVGGSSGTLVRYRRARCRRACRRRPCCRPAGRW